jgi:phage tail-like protein
MGNEVHMVTTRGRIRIVSLAVLILGLPTHSFARQQSKLSLYQFTVEIEGLNVGAFREVSGIGIETEVTEVREGGSNDVHKLPGRIKFPNVTLKRGFTGSRELYDWAASHATGKGVRRSVTITLMDLKGATTASWTLNRAFPVKWQPPSLNASGNEVLIETLELAHEGVTMTSGKK